MTEGKDSLPSIWSWAAICDWIHDDKMTVAAYRP